MGAEEERKAKLVRLLEEIDGITHTPWPSRDDGFSGLHFKGKEIGHFHHFAELDLKLGKDLIEQQGLMHPSGSKAHPKRAAGSAYIELPFDCDGHLLEIVRLVKLLTEKAKKSA